MNAMARMGILVGGRSAPGINSAISAISAAVIEVVNSGLSVVGIVDGYKHLADGRTDMARPLAMQPGSKPAGCLILRLSVWCYSAYSR